MRTAIIIVLTLMSHAACAQVSPENLKQKARDGLTKSCLANQISSKENENLSADLIVRYCSCIGKHGVEFLTNEDLIETGNSGLPSGAVQRKLQALSKTCASCITNPPCTDE